MKISEHNIILSRVQKRNRDLRNADRKTINDLTWRLTKISEQVKRFGDLLKMEEKWFI